MFLPFGALFFEAVFAALAAGLLLLVAAHGAGAAAEVRHPR
jgi:hypothetical protein